MQPIKVELQLDTGRFQTDLQGAIAALQGIQSGANKTGSAIGKVKVESDKAATSLQRTTGASQSLLSAWRDIAIVGNVFARAVAQITNVSHGWLGEIVRVNAEMERLNFQMRAMSTADDPIKDAAESVAWLRKEATQAPFSLKAITNSFVKLKAARLDPQGGTLRAFLDGLAAFGAGDEQLHRVSIAITQMAGKSVIQMEELRQQLGEHMPTAMRLMARSMGMTVAELTKVVSTGTLDARDSLEKLSKEMNRTYGGAAIRMMQTFSGQVTQMKANIQLLMTDEGGKAFFDVIKEQLLDINDFLSSNNAKVYAKQFGEALANVVVTIKDVVSWFWKWRDVIVTIGTTLTGMYVIKKFSDMARGLSVALVGGMGNLRQSLTGVATSLVTVGTGLNGLRTGQGIMASLGVAAIGLRGAFTALTASIPLIGIGLLALQGIVEIFNNWESATDKAAKKTRELYEAAKEGAAPSYEATKEAIDNQKALLQGELEEIQGSKGIAYNNMMIGVEGYIDDSVPVDLSKISDLYKKTYDDIVEQEKAKQQELEAVYMSEEDVLNAKAESDMARGKRAVERSLALNKEAEAANKNYNDRQNQLDTLREKEIQNAINTGGSVQKITNKFNRESIIEQKKLYNVRIRIATEERKKIEDLHKQGKIGGRDYLGAIEGVEGYIKEAQAALDDLDISKMIAKTLAAGKDANNVRINSGVKTLNKLKQALEDTKAEAIGMGSAYATMVAKIQNGTFGDYEDLFGQELQTLQKIHQELRDMAAEKTIFDKMKEGYQSLNNDIEQAGRKRQNEKIRLDIRAKEREIGRSLTEAEKIKLKIDKGDYFGIGAAADIREQLRKTIEVMNTQGQLAHHLGEVLRDNTFSEATDNAIEATANKVETVNDKLRDTAGILSGISFDAFSDFGRTISTGLTSIGAGFGLNFGATATPALTNLPKDVENRMAQAMQHLMSKGWSQQASSGMVGNMVAESGLDPTILGDNGTSVGLAQWHNERMTAMKRWIAEQGRDWKDFHAQLDFLDHELRTSHAAVGDKLRSVKDTNTAARLFMNEFERPSESAKRESWGKRSGAARRSYDIADSKDFTNQVNLPKGATVNQKGQVSIPIEFKPIPIDSEKTKSIVDQLVGLWEKAKPHFGELLEIDQDEDMALRFATIFDETQQFTYTVKEQREMLRDLGVDASEMEKRLWKLVKDAGGDFYAPKIQEARQLVIETNMQAKAFEANAKQVVDLEKRMMSANERIAEYNKLAANPNWQGQSEAIKKIRDEFEPLLRDIENAPSLGKSSSEYQTIAANMQAALAIQSNVELAALEANTAKEEQVFRRSLMTKSQLRAAELQDAIAQIEERGRLLIEAGANEIAVTEQVEREKKRIRQEANEKANPVLNQMREWQDIQGQLEQAATGWMNSLADGIAGLITGTGDLRGAIQGIINDIAKMATKWLLSGLFGGTGQDGKPALKQMFTKSATTAHTGGIAGNGAMLRSMSALAWAGAPKFHSGGFVGGLLPSEVPIIAKKGEGVFTPEQMKAMGGFQQNQVVQINSPITVNGSAGTPEQNGDLAKQMAREMDSTMRAIIVDEMRKQTRPGSMMNTRAR